MPMLLRVLILVGLFYAPALRADDPADEIRAVISEQIEALRADDFETAFSFASPMIKSMFGDAATFGTMVRNGYPMVWRPSDVRFSGLSTRGDLMVQNVLVTDQSGMLHIVRYEMVMEAAGWRINGVSLQRAGDAGA